MNRAERRRNERELAVAPPSSDRITIGFVHPGEVSTVFMDCVDRMKRYELARTGMWLGMISRRAGAGWLAGARNYVTQEFLNSESDWLLFIDTDMGFPEWSVQRMLGAARGGESFKPIIGGLCFALTAVGWDPITNAERYDAFPTIGIWNRDTNGEILGYRHVWKYDKDTVLKVDQTGAAMVMIHRSVFETVGSEWWTPIDVPENAGLDGRGHFSEDVSFFIRVANAGLEVWLDTMVKTSHHKERYVTEEDFDLQMELKPPTDVLS